MQIIESVSQLRTRLVGEAEVSFVPTMGNLHEGHIDLARRARRPGNCVVVSIFVNPLQFGPNEDFGRYPRTFKADCEKLAAVGVDIVFAPSVEEMYPQAQDYFIEPPALANELCGAHRPGHFKGVATVVLKLFSIVQPHTALFGKKDYQQLAIIRGMVSAFNLPIEIIGCDTVRAEDGLALSSRNGYLSATERQEAVRLSRVLTRIKKAIEEGQADIARIEQEGTMELKDFGWQVDYISVRDAENLMPPNTSARRLVALGAAKLGTTRLIDNIEICRA